MTRLLVLSALAMTPGGWNGEYWDKKSPNANADRLVRLFKNVCLDHLGRSREMHRVVYDSGAGFGSAFDQEISWGPVWMSPFGSIAANDHGHHHDGDECRIELRPSIAPSVQAVAKALRRQGLVKGVGEPAEFGATVFHRGETQISVRYDVAERATGVTDEDAGLTLLIQRPPG